MSLCIYVRTSFGLYANIYIGGIYIEVFSSQPRDRTFIFALIILLGWAKLKFYCTYANHKFID